MEVRNTFTGGMNSDTSKRNRKNNDYTFASNFRLNTDEGDANGALETIKGNLKLIEIPTIDSNVDIYNYNASYNNFSDIPTGYNNFDDFDIIGYCEVRDDLVLFTTSTTSTDDGQLWHVTFDRTLKPGDIGFYDIKLIYSNALNFSKDTLIGNESIPSIEGWKTVVYWTDNNNLLRSFNIEHPEALSVNLGSIDILSDTTFSNIGTTVSVGGNYKSGVVQHAYRLYNSGTGKQSNISILSPPSTIIEGNPLDYNSTGSLIDVSTNKKATVSISGLDNVNYDSIIVYSFFRNVLGNNPSIKIVRDTNIPSSGSISVIDTDDDDNIKVSFDEVMIDAYIFKAKTIEEKDNRLVAANITEEFFDTSSVDCRAYRFRNDGGGVYKTYVNDAGGAFPIDFTVGTTTQATLDAELLLLDEKEDAINPHNDTNAYKLQDFTLSNKPTFTTGTISGVDGGGYGPVISYSFYTGQIGNHAPEDACTTWAGISYSVQDSISRMSYQRDEVYRFGVVFYNKKGQKSFVNWIGDIRMPLEGGIANTGSDYDFESASPLYVDFNIRWDNVPQNIKDELSGVEIVRVERTDEDKTIRSQGIIGASLEKDITGTIAGAYLNKYSVMPITTPIAGTYFKNDGSGHMYGELDYDKTEFNFKNNSTGNYISTIYPNLSRTTEVGVGTDEIHQTEYPSGTFNNCHITQDILEYMSPDNDFNKNNTPEVGDDIEIVGIVGVPIYKDASCNNEGSDLRLNSSVSGTAWTTFKENAVNNVMAFNFKYYIPFGDIERFKIKHSHVIQSDLSNNIVDTITVDKAIANPYDNQYNPNCDNLNPGTSTDAFIETGTCTLKNGVVLEPSTSITKDVMSVNNVNTLMHDAFDSFVIGDDGEYLLAWYYLVNIRINNPNQYNGNTYTDRASNEYINTGYFKALNLTGTPSDTQLLTLHGDVFINHYDHFRSEINTTRGSEAMKTSVINRFPCESSINLALRSDRFDPYYLDAAKNGTYSYLASNQVQGIRDSKFEDYNFVYSNQDTLVKYFPKPNNFHFVNNKDTKIIISSKKINGELIDKWNKFDVNIEIETDTKYGPINDLINDNNKMVYFQDKGVGVVAINERAIVTTKDGAQTSLGASGLLSRFDYMSRKYGMKDKFANASGMKGIYFMDTINKKYITLSGGIISDIKGLNTIFTNVDNDYEYVLGFNKHMNEVLISRKYTGSKSITCSNCWYTISYNELFGIFNGYQSFSTDFFIKSNLELYSIPSPMMYDKNNTVYLHDYGAITEFYDEYYNNDIKYITIPKSYGTAIYNNIEYMLEATDSLDNDDYEKNFNSSEFSTSYQTEAVTDNSTNSKRRMRVWRMQLPRHNRARLRDFYLETKLTNTDSGYRLVLNDVVTKYNPNSY